MSWENTVKSQAINREAASRPYRIWARFEKEHKQDGLAEEALRDPDFFAFVFDQAWQDYRVANSTYGPQNSEEVYRAHWDLGPEVDVYSWAKAHWQQRGFEFWEGIVDKIKAKMDLKPMAFEHPEALAKKGPERDPRGCMFVSHRAKWVKDRWKITKKADREIVETKMAERVYVKSGDPGYIERKAEAKKAERAAITLDYWNKELAKAQIIALVTGERKYASVIEAYRAWKDEVSKPMDAIAKGEYEPEGNGEGGGKLPRTTQQGQAQDVESGATGSQTEDTGTGAVEAMVEETYPF
jgi:hypothetical protein